MTLQLGDFVLSKSGRDAGRMFIVCGIIDSAFVFIADGDLRKTDNPKKKRAKHLELLEKRDEAISAKLMKGHRVTDAELREALKVTR